MVDEQTPKTRAPPDYLDRRGLLALIPLSMSTIDALEKAGVFPSRFILTPTTRVAWKRSEVVRFLEQRARIRVHPDRSAAPSES